MGPVVHWRHWTVSAGKAVCAEWDPRRPAEALSRSQPGFIPSKGSSWLNAQKTVCVGRERDPAPSPGLGAFSCQLLQLLASLAPQESTEPYF